MYLKKIRNRNKKIKIWVYVQTAIPDVMLPDAQVSPLITDAILTAVGTPDVDVTVSVRIAFNPIPVVSS